jgi:hypothetical protein
MRNVVVLLLATFATSVATPAFAARPTPGRSAAATRPSASRVAPSRLMARPMARTARARTSATTIATTATTRPAPDPGSFAALPPGAKTGRVIGAIAAFLTPTFAGLMASALTGEPFWTTAGVIANIVPPLNVPGIFLAFLVATAGTTDAFAKG